MKIAVTGEGVTDYGAKEYGTTEWKWGPVAIYLTRIAEQNNVEVELYPIPREQVDNLRLQRRSLMGLEGKAIPSRKFAELMKREKCVYGVYFCDADRETGAKNSSAKIAEKQLDKRYHEVILGLESECHDKIPMIPLRMIENWIMSDISAIEKVYDKKFKKVISQKDCELLWGDKYDPDSNYPKNYLARMVHSLDKNYEEEPMNAETFCKIAEQQNLDTVRAICHRSFEKFYSDYMKMLEHGEPVEEGQE